MRTTIKVGSVAITVYPWKHPSGREYWRFDWRGTDGKRHTTTRATEDDAKKAAREKAREISNGVHDLAELTKDQRLMVRAFLDLRPTWDDVARIRGLLHRESKTLGEGIEAFLRHKQATAGASPHNLVQLRRHLARFRNDFDGWQLADFRKSDIDGWLSELKKRDGWLVSARTRLNFLRSISTFFAWCAQSDLIADNPAAKAAKPNVVPKAPQTWTPDELGQMLAAVSPKYAPWLAISAFCGVRSEELYPAGASRKTRLMWPDIRWLDGIIEIPASTSKTGRRRIIPIPAALRPWLEYHGTLKASGPVCRGRPPGQSTTLNRQPLPSETHRLGELVGGGWRKNALRHSFCSYRCALVGAGQTANEAGNSEAVIRSSYEDARSRADALAWFGLRPEQEGICAV